MSKRASILRFYEDLARDYDCRFNNPRLNYMRSVEKMVLLGSLKPGMILDIGCGTGEQSLFLAKRGYQVVGVDISREMSEAAMRHAITSAFTFRIAGSAARPAPVLKATLATTGT